LHGVTLQTGWMQPQMVMKNCFLSDSLEPHEFPSFNTAKSCSPNKPKSNANRQKRKKNIFNHFRDKPARALSPPPLNGKVPLLEEIQPLTPILDDAESWLRGRSLFLGAALSGALFAAIRSVVGSESIFLYLMLNVLIVAAIIWHLFILPLLLLIATLRKIRTK
jgi:hypothetical protein